MKLKKISFLTSLLASLVGSNASGQTLILGDDYTAPNNGSGFALDTGVNSGINPPVTRMTGSAAPNLRYIKAFGSKNDSAHTVNSAGQLRVNRVASESSTLSLSLGSGPFDFSSALNTLAATPSVPVVYDLTVKISNGAAGSQRCSFALSSAPGTAGAWDFALQLYHPSGDAYTLQKRISANASGTGSAINLPITTVGTYSDEVEFLIRVTDAGAEVDTSSSRVQVSIDGGSTWLYDTMSDTDIAGFRFPGASRFVFFDIAGGAGPVTFDDFSLNFISGPTTSDRVWTGAGADDNWSTGANWGGSAPGTGDTLTFDGTTRQANFNDITDLTVPWVAFNNGGFQLSGNTLFITDAITNRAGENVLNGDISWSSASAKYWSIASGSEVVLNNNNTVEENGEHRIHDGGTMRLTGSMTIGATTTANPAFVVNEGRHVVDGGTFSSRGGYRIGSIASAAGGAQTILTNNANFTLTVAGGNLRVGDSANPVPARLVVDNSTLTMTGGSIGIPYVTGGTAEVLQNGGLVAGAIVNFSQGGAGVGTYTIKDGTLEPRQIKENTSGGQSGIYFDNVILRSTSEALTPFFSGVDVAEVQAGGLTIEANSDIYIDQVLSGNGSVTKTGSSKVTLAGASTYTGGTEVQSGSLYLATGATNASAVQVADGAEFGAVVASPGTTGFAPSVQFNGGSFGTLGFDLGTFSNPTAPLLHVGSLSVNGPVIVNIHNGNLLVPGQFVLVDYDGAIGGGFQFTLGSLPAGVIAELVNNTINSSIDLNITGVPGLRWTGAVDGNWDDGTQNWIDLQTSAAATFVNGFPTEFTDDAAIGDINVATFPSPSALIVSNDTLPYVWSGEFFITSPLLIKSGSGSLTRNGGEIDEIGEIQLNDGSFAVNHFFDTAITTVLTDDGVGAGTFVKKGISTLTINSANSDYDGAVVIEEGTVKLGANRSLGSTVGGTTIAAGATLDVNDMVPGEEPITVSGSGVNGQGAIIDSTSAGAVATTLRNVTLAGDTTFGSPNGGRWDIRVRASTGPAPGLKGNGFNLTKVGSGSVSIAAQRNLGEATPYWEMNLGDILVSEGTLTFAESVSLGNPAAGLTVSSGAALTFYDLGATNPILRTITMNDARLAVGGGPADTNVVNGGIQLNGANAFHLDEAQLIVNGGITGSGSITVTSHANGGTLVLNGNNNYSGDTTVDSGTISGNGVIAGNLIFNNGTIAPGSGGVGTLTVNGNVTLGTATTMELDRSQSPNSDRLVVGGTFNVSGTLNVVLGADASAPQAGDVYQLFNKAGSGTFSTINLPDLSSLPGDLAWDTANLSVDGTITVTGTATPPTIGTVSVNGGNFVFEGTGGVEGATYIVLSSPDVALPIANWIPVATNTFGAGGSFSYTSSVESEAPTMFFMLQLP